MAQESFGSGPFIVVSGKFFKTYDYEERGIVFKRKELVLKNTCLISSIDDVSSEHCYDGDVMRLYSHGVFKTCAAPCTSKDLERIWEIIAEHQQ